MFHMINNQNSGTAHLLNLTVMRTLSDLIHTGWPSRKKFVNSGHIVINFLCKMRSSSRVIKWSYWHHYTLTYCSNSMYYIRAWKRPRSLHVNLSIGLVCQNLSRKHVPAVLNAKRCNNSSHLNSPAP